MVKPENHRRGFVKVGYNFHRFLAWMAWYGPTRVFQKLVLHTPPVAIPIFMSEFNYDAQFTPVILAFCKVTYDELHMFTGR